MAIFRTNRKRYETRVRRRNVLNIVTILSTMLVILKLLFAGFIGIQTAGIIVVAVVIFLAIGNPFAKLAIILIGIYLFVKSYTGMNVQAFEFLLVQVGVLALVLVGLYIMIKSMFR